MYTIFARFTSQKPALTTGCIIKLMSYLLFFAGIVFLTALIVCSFALVVRSNRASIAALGEAQAKALAGIQEKVYKDLADFFEPAAEGQPSEFGNVIAGMGELIADRIVVKFKAAAIGSAGGSAERTKKSGNPLLGLMMNYLAGGAAGGLSNLVGAGRAPDDQGNHQSSSSPKFTL